MFGSVASYYEEEFDTAVANLASLIEPIMIVFMGITIGGLMLAMYAPIFNVGAIIGWNKGFQKFNFDIIGFFFEILKGMIISSFLIKG